MAGVHALVTLGGSEKYHLAVKPETLQALKIVRVLGYPGPEVVELVRSMTYTLSIIEDYRCDISAHSVNGFSASVSLCVVSFLKFNVLRLQCRCFFTRMQYREDGRLAFEAAKEIMDKENIPYMPLPERFPGLDPALFKLLGRMLRLDRQVPTTGELLEDEYFSDMDKSTIKSGPPKEFSQMILQVRASEMGCICFLNRKWWPYPECCFAIESL